MAIPPLTPPDFMSPGARRAVRRPSWISVAVGPAASASSTDSTDTGAGSSRWTGASRSPWTRKIVAFSVGAMDRVVAVADGV